MRFWFYEVNLGAFKIEYHELKIQLHSWPLLSKKTKTEGFRKCKVHCFNFSKFWELRASHVSQFPMLSDFSVYDILSWMYLGLLHKIKNECKHSISTVYRALPQFWGLLFWCFTLYWESIIPIRKIFASCIDQKKHSLT